MVNQGTQNVMRKWDLEERRENDGPRESGKDNGDRDREAGQKQNSSDGTRKGQSEEGMQRRVENL
jgi:hypothetical protein